MPSLLHGDLAPATNQTPDLVERACGILIAAPIEVAKVRRHANEKAQLVYTQICARKVRFLSLVNAASTRNSKTSRASVEDAIPEHKFLALREVINGRNEPQQELIVSFDGRAGALDVVTIHDISQNIATRGFAPGPKRQSNKDLRGKKRPAQAEADDVDPRDGGDPAADRGAEVVWSTVPGTAAEDTVGCNRRRCIHAEPSVGAPL